MSYIDGSIFEFSVDPTVNDDNTAGYQKGHVWINTTTKAAFVCLDASTGAALWGQVNNLVASYAELYESNDTGTAYGMTESTWEKWTSSTVGQSTGTDYANADAGTDRITIGSKGAGTYQINATASVKISNGSLTHLGVFKNGTLQENIRTADEKGSNQKLDLAATGELTLSSGDYIELYFMMDIASPTITIYRANISLHRISGSGSSSVVVEPGSAYSETVTSWTPDSGLYYADVNHALGTKNVTVEAFKTADDKTVGLEEVERTGIDVVRVWVATQENLRIVVINGGADSGLTKRLIYADDFIVPINSDWAVTTPALISPDPDYNSMSVVRFDDTTEEAVGFKLEIPENVTYMDIRPRGRAITAPGAARTVGTKLYSRGFPDNAAVESWDSGTQLADIDITTNAYPQYDEDLKTLSSLGLTAGRVYLFQYSRVAPSGGTNLTGDWALLELCIVFS